MKLHYIEGWTEPELQAILAAVDKLPGRYALGRRRGMGWIQKAVWWRQHIATLRAGAELGIFMPGKQIFNNDWRTILAVAGIDCNRVLLVCRSANAPLVRRGRIPRGLIAKAAALYAGGMKIKDIAAKMGESANFMRRIQERHPEVWAAAVGAAMLQTVEHVRRLAGTNGVLEINDYLARAENTERWARRSSQPIFTPAGDGQHTLTTFFEQYYRPVCMSDSSPLSVDHYRRVLRKWALLTGDPPLQEISSELLAKYRDALAGNQRAKGTAAIAAYRPHAATAPDDPAQQGWSAWPPQP